MQYLKFPLDPSSFPKQVLTYLSSGLGSLTVERHGEGSLQSFTSYFLKALPLLPYLYAQGFFTV